MSAVDWPRQTEYGLRCMTDAGEKCPNLAIYDRHYPYCKAQPDSSPALRPGGGKFLVREIPNHACPLLALKD